MIRKKHLIHFFRQNFPILFCLFIACLFRFVWLDRLPVGVVHDELTYLLNAKAIALSGTDVTGTWNPLSAFFFHYPPGSVQAELPYFLFVPVFLLFPMTLFTAHITNAVIGVATVFVIYLLSKELLGNRIAFFAGLLSAVNPWMVVINRTAYEVTPAVFFYVVGLYVLLKAKKWKILAALPLFFLGFYAYIGTKLIFLLIVAMGVGFAWIRNKREYKKQYIVFFLIALIFLGIYVVSLFLMPRSSRIGDLFSFSDPAIIKEVNALRSTSLVSPTTALFDNKISVGIIILVKKFFTLFSFDYLFLYGDSFFSLWHQGLFYYLDALFLLLGIIGVYIQSKKVWVFLLALILVGTIPQLAHSASVSNFTPHIAFIFPFMIILIASGIEFGTQFFEGKLKQIVAVMIVLAYMVLIGNFVQIYFFQSPIENGFSGFPDRVAIHYISLVSKNHPVFVYSHQPVQFAERYLFYTNTTKVPFLKMKIALSTGELHVGDVSLYPCRSIDTTKINGAVIVDSLCNNNNPPRHISVSQLIDGGEVYGIYNDTLCSQYSLKPFVSGLTIQDFAVESMPSSLFCTRFITSH